MRAPLQSTRVLAFIALMIMAGHVFFIPSVSAAFKYLQEGMTAPSIDGKDIISGADVSTDDFAGRNVVVVAFWSTWSARSLQELSDLKSLAVRYQDHPLKIMAVNVENQQISPSQADKINQTVSDMELPFPVIVDRGLEIFYSYGVIAVPSTAVLDTSGTMRYGPSGYSLTTKDLIIDTIEVLLGLRKPSAESVLVDGYIPEPRASRYYNLALQLAKQRMWSRALSNLDQAEQADSNFSAPHNLRGQILLEMNKPDEATSVFETAVALDSNSVAAKSGLGRALMKTGQVDSAFEILSEVLAMDSTYTPAVLDMALCISQRGETEKAIGYLHEARDLNPRNPNVHYYLGEIYMNAGRTGEALDSYRTALEILYPGY
jgi:thioredoxin-like negative regulator of GroEL